MANGTTALPPPDFNQVPTSVGGVTAPASFNAKPIGIVSPVVGAGFVPTEPSPMDGWRFDNLANAYYGPGETLPPWSIPNPVPGAPPITAP